MTYFIEIKVSTEFCGGDNEYLIEVPSVNEEKIDAYASDLAYDNMVDCGHDRYAELEYDEEEDDDELDEDNYALCFCDWEVFEGTAENRAAFEKMGYTIEWVPYLV